MANNESLLTYMDRVLSITERLAAMGGYTNEMETCYKILSSIGSTYAPITMTCMQVSQDRLNLAFLRQQFSLEQSRSTMSLNGRQAGATAQNPVTLNTTSAPKCHKCGSTTHLAATCNAPQWRIDSYRDRANTSRGGRGRGNGRGGSTNRGNNRGGRGGSGPSNQYSNNAVTFLMVASKTDGQEANVATNVASPSFWYLDSGCTQHMSTSPDVLL